MYQDRPGDSGPQSEVLDPTRAHETNLRGQYGRNMGENALMPH